ncbi:hypothetical protein QWM81_03985 [Streptomyces ficellus]|uniref:DUF6777 domain-containing protein n=1 Tax=Streptomyces ficellus TaxID=1977088 RepID=A0ABT7Z149_9ACTN|nr:DUF6777 domain-containing protein [Streptomyces ficellus]MDN3293222.1 hypothetical protein [Streptomyces ficellus]
MPGIAIAATAVVVAVVLAVVLTRPDGDGGGTGGGSGTLSLQSAAATGPDPFTDSTARDDPDASPSPTVQVPTTPPPPGANTVRQYEGSRPGLYGGTRKVASCDVERQIRYLTAEPAKNRAFASALRIQPPTVPDYLRSLTPLRLRADTWVTNHGYRDGAPQPYQAALQSGTAVLVDNRGAPRVRCACGNPLADPVITRTAPRPVGTPWPGFRVSNTVVVKPAVRVVKVFVIVDIESGDWVVRKPGDSDADNDRETKPPSISPTDTGTSPPPSSPEPTPPPSPSPQAPESPGTTEPPVEPETADTGTATEEAPPADTATEQPPEGGSPAAPGAPLPPAY